MSNLEEIFKPHWGLGITNNEPNLSKKYPLLYGELTKSGFIQLKGALKKIGNLNADSIFYDIGSGTGKIVLAMTEVIGCCSIGVEVVKTRHDIAVASLKRYSKNNDDINKVLFINDTFENINLQDATIVYCDAIAWNSKLIDKLISKLPKECILVTNKGIAKIKYSKLPKVIDDKTLLEENAYTVNTSAKPTTYSTKGKLYIHVI